MDNIEKQINPVRCLLSNRVKALPAFCGVYIMKGAEGEVLYIGKARNIKKRVSSYFYNKAIRSPRTDLLVSKVKNIDYIPATCEAEALILESSLIKKHRPKYNVELKDDKSYPYLKLTAAEEYPRLFITRSIKNDGSMYFGPYTNAKLLRQAVYMLNRIFLFRTCSRMPKEPCLNYDLGQCWAPCAGRIDREKYNEMVKELVLFLEGRKSELIEKLTAKMTALAGRQNFEGAASVRDRIEALTTAVKGRVKFRFEDIMEELKHALELKKAPRRIEAFDISDLYGKEAVGSMVAFYNMKFEKDSYRKFKIKTVRGIDDYKMMSEIITRRYRRLLDEKAELPDLIIIDGGKGHLSVAKSALDGLGLSLVPVMGIAKEFEHIYLPDKKEPIKLARNSGILHLIQRIRDEAHRFAIYYHRSLRGKKSVSSELDDIKGIGAKRKKTLIRHFGSVGALRKAGLEELLKVKGMNKNIAERLIKYFRD